LFFEPGLAPWAIDFRPVGAFRLALNVGRSAFNVCFLNQGLRPLLLTVAPSGLFIRRWMFDVRRLPAVALAEAGSMFGF